MSNHIGDKKYNQFKAENVHSFNIALKKLLVQSFVKGQTFNFLLPINFGFCIINIKFDRFKRR